MPLDSDKQKQIQEAADRIKEIDGFLPSCKSENERNHYLEEQSYLRLQILTLRSE